jgi:flagellar biosynthesis/type III secretory pathway chaperone
MKTTLISGMAQALMIDLQEFAGVCEGLLAMATREHQALAGRADYQPLEFYQRRKTLLPDIELLVKKFRSHRATWQQVPPAEREHFTELKALFQSIQGLLMRVLQLDRENQEAMLKRGLVPVKHLPSAAVQKPHYVTDLYRRNSVA